MNPNKATRWLAVLLVLAVAVLASSAQPPDGVGIVGFRLVAIVGVVCVVSLSEWFVPSFEGAVAIRVASWGAARGAVAGCCMWIMITWLASCCADRGDKFPLFVVYYAPAPTVAGLVAGALSSWRRGKLKPSRLL